MDDIDLEEIARVELAWCQDFLEKNIRAEKNIRLKNEKIKGYNVLLSKASAMAKKRMVMSKYCGDYRTKIADEIKSNTQAICDLAAKEDLPQNSRVIRTTKQDANKTSRENSTADFQFDFGN